ncbi:hypothetical protein DEFDS_P055 (plasmid) [Deferribacter desulfuricans SSM1]|uniref:Uncharacterized protein n=1 Tax=Deferribacter desulfuricans (strain DSM 14783 / JCM 11476 / NBRC 101012 / SSM1) TaxID=639282 RepID=D3PEN7_DEFDS|nr:hypothetical protein [Deferribacter desulfuricans]BAI81679.1 hypothetical protein DEFDS_P055 [Deferribacter desulfuricans SSM1]
MPRRLTLKPGQRQVVRFKLLPNKLLPAKQREYKARLYIETIEAYNSVTGNVTDKGVIQTVLRIKKKVGLPIRVLKGNLKYQCSIEYDQNNKIILIKNTGLKTLRGSLLIVGKKGNQENSLVSLSYFAADRIKKISLNELLKDNQFYDEYDIVVKTSDSTRDEQPNRLICSKNIKVK